MAQVKTITRENRAVVINIQKNDSGSDFVWANLYVNARAGLMNADITTRQWTGRTVRGAEKWAEKVLA